MTRESVAGINSRLVDFSSVFGVVGVLLVFSTASWETGEGERRFHAETPITMKLTAARATSHRFFVVIGRVGFSLVLNQKSEQFLLTLSYVTIAHYIPICQA